MVPAAGGRSPGHFRSLPTGWMLHGDRVGEDDRVRNDDLAPFLGGDDRRPRLDVVDRALNAGDADEIADAERLLQKQQNTGEEILQNVLKGEADGNAPDSKDLDKIGRLKRWSNHGQGDKKTKNDDAGVNEPAEEQCDSLMLTVPDRDATD
jgi:hypothetical protein